MMMLISCSNSKTQENESTTVPLPEGKEIYIPKDLQKHGLCKTLKSKWSYHCMAYRKLRHLWEKGLMTTCQTLPQLEGHSMKVNLKNLEEKLEHFYHYFYHTLQFAKTPDQNATNTPHDGYDQLFTGRNRLWWRLWRWDRRSGLPQPGTGRKAELYSAWTGT